MPGNPHAPARVHLDVIARAAAVLASLALSTCPFGKGSGSDVAAIRAGQDLWRANAVSSYEMTIEQGCFCPITGKWRVVVENGVITEATPLTGQDATGLDPDFFNTIDELYDQVLSFANSWPDATIDVSIDGRGVPMSGNLDAPNVVDEEYGWTLSDVDLAAASES